METEQMPGRELTTAQRVAHRLCKGLAADMDRGTHAEQHTAALLRLCADAIEHGYEAELVALAGAWRLERERHGDWARREIENGDAQEAGQ